MMPYKTPRVLKVLSCLAGAMLLVSPVSPQEPPPAGGSRPGGDTPQAERDGPSADKEPASVAGDPKPDEIWLLVAKSQVIATGTLRVPVESIRSCLSSKRHQYVELTVHRDEALKGSPPAAFQVRWFTKPVYYSPDPERVIQLDGKTVMVLLVQVDEASVKGLYFAGSTPRALAEAELTAQVRREVAAQREMLEGFADALPPAKEPLYAKVKDLMDAATRKDTQMDAFRQLEELGQKGVPAIIMLMDDRRDIAIPRITLRNPPGHWEAVRHYSPKKIVDASSAILNQITAQSFGSIYNGGTETERQATVDGWRIHLLKRSR